MNDDTLFPIPESPISPLDAARVRLGLAEDEYRRHELAEDEYGDPMPGEVAREYRLAKQEVAQLETAELARIRG